MASTALEIINDALTHIGALAPGETVDGEVGQFALRILNDLIDTWQAQQVYVYSYNFAIYTMVANLLVHTIGPSGVATFATTGPRPVRLESAAQLLNTAGTLVDLPINLRDNAWWAANQTKEITTNVVTDVYYDPTSPDGSLYFWPVPNQNNQVRLQLWTTVNQFNAITDPIGGPGGPGTLPQGYRNALKLTLAELLCPSAQKEPTQTLVRAALMARTAIMGNNAKSPRIMSQDWGMPSSRKYGVRGDFNWESGAVGGSGPQ